MSNKYNYSETKPKREEFEDFFGWTAREWVEDGKGLSEYNSLYNSYFQDPNAFSNTYAENIFNWGPDPAFLSSLQGEKQTQGISIDSVNEDRARGELQRVRDQKEEKLGDPGRFRVGTVLLTVPPAKISVADIQSNNVVQILRQKTDIILQGGHGVKVLEFDTMFHNIDEINEKLRPLIAQLKCSPFIPIYNDYVSSIIYPDPNEVELLDKDGEKVNVKKEMDRIRSDVGMAKQELLDLVNQKMAVDTSINPSFARDISSYMEGNIRLDNLSGFDPDQSLLYNVLDTLRRNHGPSTLEHDIQKKTAETERRLAKAREERSNLSKKIPQTQIKHGNIVGALSELRISTVPGFPSCLQCNFTFYIFNYHPFSDKFEFLDVKDTATPDIDKCEYFIRWYEKRFLNGSSRDFLKKINPDTNGYFSVAFDAPTVEGEKFGDTIFFTETDDDTVCSAITISLRNNLSFLPILSWDIPTCQYLGGKSPQFVVSIETKDEIFIDRIKYLFEVVNSYTLSADKFRRKNWVLLQNDVLGMAGITNAVLESIDIQTVPGSIGVSIINMRLIAFDPEQLQDEEFVQINAVSIERLIAYFYADLKSGVITDALLKEALVFRGSENFAIQPLVDAVRLGFRMGSVIGTKAYDYFFGKTYPTIDTFLSKIKNGIDERRLILPLLGTPTFRSWFERAKQNLEEYFSGDPEALEPHVAEELKNRNLGRIGGEGRNLYLDLELPIYADVGCPKPSYAALGRVNYVGEGRSGSPRVDSDQVETDFYMHNTELKNYSTGKLEGFGNSDYYGAVESSDKIVVQYTRDFYDQIDKNLSDYSPGVDFEVAYSENETYNSPTVIDNVEGSPVRLAFGKASSDPKGLFAKRILFSTGGAKNNNG